MGYHRAGFDVAGVDIEPQPRYPFAFIRADALEYVAAHGHEYDAIAASPPCQRYSVANRVQRSAERHPDLVAPTRRALRATGRPYVIENVVGAPLVHPIMLCGTMFGLQVFRHRLFECSFFLLVPPHGKHQGSANSHRWGKHRYDDLSGGYVTVCGGGNCRVETARKAMGIEWMTKAELNQAIPPAYTEFIGAQLLRALGRERAA
jgi:DNA (cytosine-5)-methyltransferase 1